jgi:hypothetical protein
VNEFNDRYPTTGHIDVSVEVIPVFGVFAGTSQSGRTIFLEETYAEFPHVFNRDVAENVEHGYFPSGCTPARLIAIHEFGHVLDNQNGRRARQALAQLASSGQLEGTLTGYSFHNDGTLHPGEALANAFAAVHCGTANALEHRIFQLLLDS